MADAHEPVLLRPAVLADAEAIVEIYNNEVLRTVATLDLVPRTIQQQRDWLSARSGAFTAIVAVDRTSEQVVGFAALSAYKERAAYATTVEDSIYVHRDFGGRGIGKQLLGHLIQIARESGFHVMMARIESSGTASRALHASCGFELIGIEREVGRKFKRWLDVVSMQRML
ncbi:MAG TPA: GNAT family N-acetyltransferase [Ilumatobacter sp.]|nr:GNAT family N-acetyltransferase [Ilumatobacter sp.]